MTGAAMSEAELYNEAATDVRFHRAGMLLGVASETIGGLRVSLGAVEDRAGFLDRLNEAGAIVFAASDLAASGWDEDVPMEERAWVAERCGLLASAAARFLDDGDLPGAGPGLYSEPPPGAQLLFLRLKAVLSILAGEMARTAALARAASAEGEGAEGGGAEGEAGGAEERPGEDHPAARGDVP